MPPLATLLTLVDAVTSFSKSACESCRLGPASLYACVLRTGCGHGRVSSADATPGDPAQPRQMLGAVVLLAQVLNGLTLRTWLLVDVHKVNALGQHHVQTFQTMPGQACALLSKATHEEG